MSDVRQLEEEVMNDGILHLPVKYDQVEAIKTLVAEIGDDVFINSIGVDGNTSIYVRIHTCLLYTSPSPRDGLLSRMPSSA